MKDKHGKDKILADYKEKASTPKKPILVGRINTKARISVAEANTLITSLTKAVKMATKGKSKPK